jgi:hypothetical protein
MGFLDKIKSLFTRETMPDETRLLLAGVENVHELRRGLDEIVTRNEVELKEVEREIDKLEKIEVAEKDKIKAGTLTDREKANTLRYVKRLRTRMDSYQKRHKIHQENIDLHLALLDRIDEMEAMELKAVKQEQIDEIAVDYQERFEKHKEIVNASKAAHDHEPSYEDAAEKRELEALEKEILAESGVAEAEPEAQEKVKEKPVEAVKAPVKVENKEPVKEEPRRAPIQEESDVDEPRINVTTNERRLELE